MELRFVSPLHNRSGYAKAGRALLSALQMQGISVRARELECVTGWTLNQSGVREATEYPRYLDVPMPDFQRNELNLACATAISEDAPMLIMGNPASLPSFCESSRYEKHRFGLTMWETNKICEIWERCVANVDTLVVPSDWNCETAKGLHSNVVKCSLGVDERVYSVEGKRLEYGEKQPSFLFISVFSTCERKHWREMIQAFSEEFRGEDVGLVCLPTKSELVVEMAGWLKGNESWIHVIQKK
jgi:hypothetical protein